MRVRSITEWRTRDGKRRRIRLFAAWQNMRGRCAGRLHAGNGARPWKGLQIAWRDFAEFRTWALANGYSRMLCSLDRRNPSLHYGPDNCRWLTRADNTRWMHYAPDATDPAVPF